MPKPFLKWAGGKTRLCAKINSILPTGNRLIEPFVGAGSVFLNTNYPEYLLSDVNQDLINIYRILQADGLDFIRYAEQFFTPENNTQDAYIENRAVFNSTTDTKLKSALFIYLNKHCFNGLCRYNSKGGFNVPYGKYVSPVFPEEALISFCEKSKMAEFQIADFKTTMSSAKRGDVVYCDPPYVPLTETANFTNYSSGGFNKKDQEDLANMAMILRDKGIPVLISNHDTEWVRDLYASAEIIEFQVTRSIAAKKEKRGKANEIMAFFN